jgi:putative ABC transport system permease protein
MTWWMRLVVRLYPGEWRERYQDELEAVIEQSGPGWRPAIDLARGAALMQFATGIGRVRHHARRLWATPAFTLTAVATLATAIGANALLFALVNGVLLKPLPFDQPDRLVGVWHSAPGLVPGPVNQAAFTYFTYREEATAFEDIGLWSATTATVTGRGDPEELEALSVTDGTLPVLRVRAELGRTFTAADDAPGSRDTVMLSREYWLRAFGGSPAAIGQSLMVDGRAREVIGVLPAGFALLRQTPDLVLPLRLNRATVQIGLFRHQGIARLKPGVTLAQAHADLARLVPGMPDRFPIPPGFSRAMYDEFRLAPDIHPLAHDLVGDVTGMLWVLFGAVALLLLVACANVANLFLVRTEGRRQEIAVELALGAGLRRIAGQLVGESLVVAVTSAALGLLLASGGLRVLRALAPARLPRLHDVAIDPIVMVFAAAIAVVAAAAFGLTPIVKYGRPELATALKAGGRGASDDRERQRLRHGLVAGQVAVALMLLIGSALLLRTFTAIREVRPGVANPASVLTVRIGIPEAVIADPLAAARAHEQIVRRIGEVRGVQAVGQTSSITMDGANRRDPLFADGVVGADGQLPPVRRMKWAGPGYFSAIGNPVVAGRDFSWDDVHDRRPVAVVSAVLARELFGDTRAALGQRVRPSPNGPWREIVGVTGNEHDDGPTRPPTPMVYWPFQQEDYAPGQITVERALTYAIRTDRRHDTGLLRDIQLAVWAVNPTLPLARIETAQDVFDRTTAQLSFTLVALAVAAGVTLLLGVVGIYGVIAYVVAQRRREVAIRMALGADAGWVVGLFLRHGLTTVAIGLAAGAALSVLTTRALGAWLFEVSTLDPLAYASAVALLAGVALVAVWIPARAATRVAPGLALRG